MALSAHQGTVLASLARFTGEANTVLAASFVYRDGYSEETEGATAVLDRGIHHFSEAQAFCEQIESFDTSSCAQCESKLKEVTRQCTQSSASVCSLTDTERGDRFLTKLRGFRFHTVGTQCYASTGIFNPVEDTTCGSKAVRCDPGHCVPAFRTIGRARDPASTLVTLHSLTPWLLTQRRRRSSRLPVRRTSKRRRAKRARWHACLRRRAWGSA